MPSNFIVSINLIQFPKSNKGIFLPTPGYIISFPGVEKFNILGAVKISVGVGVQAIASID